MANIVFNQRASIFTGGDGRIDVYLGHDGFFKVEDGCLVLYKDGIAIKAYAVGSWINCFYCEDIGTIDQQKKFMDSIDAN